MHPAIQRVQTAMNETQATRERSEGRDTRPSLGEIVVAGYELQAQARGALTLRALRSLGRVIACLARRRSPRRGAARVSRSPGRRRFDPCA